MSIVKTLGDVYLMKHELDKAIKMYQRAICTSEMVINQNLQVYNLLSTIQNNMGLGLMEKGYVQAAISSFSNSLMSQVLCKKDSCLAMVSTINNLASCHFDLHQYDKSLHQFQRSLDIYLKLRTRKDPLSTELSKVYNNMGLCYFEKQNYSEAYNHFQLSCSFINNDNVDFRAKLLNGIALCQSKLNCFSQALQSFQKLLDLQKILLGEDATNEDIAKTLHNTGHCFLVLGNPKRALENYHQSFKMRKQIFGDKHEKVVSCVNSIRNCFKSMSSIDNNMQRRNSLQKQSVEIFQRKQVDFGAQWNPCTNPVIYQMLTTKYRK